MTPAEANAAHDAVIAQLQAQAQRRSAIPGGAPASDDRVVAEAALDAWFTEQTRSRLRDGHRPLPAKEEEELRRTVLSRVFGLGPLQHLLDDDDIESVHINGAERVFVRTADGDMRGPTASITGGDIELVDLVRRLAAHEGLGERHWDTAAPALNLTLRDGTRLHGLMAVTRHPCVTLRRHRLLDVDLDDLVDMGTIPGPVAELLAAAIRSGQSIVIAGGPGAGKSTTLRALASTIAAARRIVTIEDTFELHLDRDHVRHPNCVATETRPPNIEGRGELSVTTMLREALRMDPDVLIVGEVRIIETVPMLLALATGNLAGSLSTVHAHSSAQSLEQLQTYAAVGPDRLPAESSARLIGSALDWVVHVARIGDRAGSARRVVTSVREVCGSQGIHVVSNEVMRRDRGGAIEVFPAISEETRDRLLDIGYDIAALAARQRFIR